MLRHKNIDRVCCAVLACTLLVAGLFVAGAAGGVITAQTTIGYETRLFDQSRVHTIDIVMDDWNGFLETCTSEEYSACHLVIDGESYKNVAIRAKGNTSLSSVAAYGNNRYSFKVEFDHYQKGKTYYGLDKLSLNNIIQDNTYMKDYFSYTLMNRMGVASPLCSFVQINVNGEAWGLYLAVEGVEEGFLQRNYGKNYGELYKPDSMSFGGGRGNGRGFDMDDMLNNGDFSFDSIAELFTQGSGTGEKTFTKADKGGRDNKAGGGFGGGNMPGLGGMGSSDVKLQYIDDDPESYSNIFSSAKTDVTEADQERLIASLKALSEGDASVVDADAVMRYMAVHNFLCNDDSYTGSMVHNYYLYEKDGVLSMIPWDYNLAFGGFAGGNATSLVNRDIRKLVNSGQDSDRPMAGWITSSEEYTAQYLEIYAEFMASVFDSGWFAEEIDRVIDMISPYVESDPTAFCTYEEFQTAAQTLKTFCLKRAESVKQQLTGDAATVDASDITLSAMGSMNNGGGDFNKQDGGFGGFSFDNGQMPTLPSFDSSQMPASMGDFPGQTNDQGTMSAPPAMPTSDSGEMADFSGSFPGQAESQGTMSDPPAMPASDNGEMADFSGSFSGQTNDQGTMSDPPAMPTSDSSEMADFSGSFSGQAESQGTMSDPPAMPASDSGEMADFSGSFPGQAESQGTMSDPPAMPASDNGEMADFSGSFPGQAESQTGEKENEMAEAPQNELHESASRNSLPSMPGTNATGWLWLGACTALLALALVFALCFRTNR